eukprot:scaffold17789_cov112-Isochrysis_galbana.AAC.5
MPHPPHVMRALHMCAIRYYVVGVCCGVRGRAPCVGSRLRAFAKSIWVSPALPYYALTLICDLILTQSAQACRPVRVFSLERLPTKKHDPLGVAKVKASPATDTTLTPLSSPRYPKHATPHSLHE